MPIINSKPVEITVYPTKVASSMSVYYRWIKWCNYLNAKYGYRRLS